MATEQQILTLEQKIKGIFKDVLDIKPEEIKSDAKLEQSLGLDSTEMVEISVAIKKKFNVPIGDNEIKKSHSVNEIIGILRTKGVN